MEEKLDTPATRRAAAAEAALTQLVKGHEAARAAGTKKLTQLFGPDADNSAVTLAVRAARVMAGGNKPRGGAGQRINELISFIEAAIDKGVLDNDSFDARDMVTAARVVLDKHKEAEAARRKQLKDDRAAAKDKLNDRGAPLAERRAAFELITELDGELANTRSSKLAARVTAAVEAAREAGFTREQLFTLVDDVFTVAPLPTPTDELEEINH